MKIQTILHNLCLHFARQDGQDEKTGKSCNFSNQNTKNQKTKIWDEKTRKGVQKSNATSNKFEPIVHSVHFFL